MGNDNGLPAISISLQADGLSSSNVKQRFHDANSQRQRHVSQKHNVSWQPLVHWWHCISGFKFQC